MPKSQFYDPEKVCVRGKLSFQDIPLLQYDKTMAQELEEGNYQKEDIHSLVWADEIKISDGTVWPFRNWLHAFRQRHQQNRDCAQNGPNIRQHLKKTHEQSQQERIANPEQQKPQQRCAADKQTGFEHTGQVAQYGVFAAKQRAKEGRSPMNGQTQNEVIGDDSTLS